MLDIKVSRLSDDVLLLNTHAHAHAVSYQTMSHIEARGVDETTSSYISHVMKRVRNEQLQPASTRYTAVVSEGKFGGNSLPPIWFSFKPLSWLGSLT